MKFMDHEIVQVTEDEGHDGKPARLLASCVQITGSWIGETPWPS